MLTVLDWILLAVAASLIGFAKTAVGGVAGLAIAVFAVVLPARESTGAVLTLLLVGDLIAVRLYRHHADWSMLLRLLPSVLPGLALGAWFVAVADQSLMRGGIGAALLAMALLQLWSRRRARVRDRQEPREPQGPRERPRGRIRALAGTAAPFSVGVIAGFATMTANAAGPVMTMYLLMAGMPVLGLLGTGAWFFFLVNLAKVPFSAGLQLIDGATLLLDLALVPPLLAGAVVGARVASRIPRRRFEDITLVLTALAAGALLV
ncbi:sulfite exporter TauE/SafE family protein [Nonomuraea sp. SYSU D8015]|uniref:sulfite exporter TauE/SafE family protein n=1 Tax=Nonomuraea sp. SYSU D8015 TaxID=2593644 RepID=UPI001CB7373D|nr:sulfite exporter TauE/SafE family protein [Nonomuraea sp. SYSU D8015]